jgi:hypothetical protein
MGPILGLCGCFYPSCAVDRSMSLLKDFVFFCLKSIKHFPASPLGGAPPMGGRAREAGPGGPPGGGPRVRPVRPARLKSPITRIRPWGGRVGAPGGPRGGLCGAQGASGGVRGPLPGGYPPGGPLVAALPTDNTPLLEPPPRGAPPGGAPGGGPRGGPPGGQWWGVRTRWGHNHATSSLTVVYRGGRGAPPKAHWVRSLQGGPKRAQF